MDNVYCIIPMLTCIIIILSYCCVKDNVKLLRHVYNYRSYIVHVELFLQVARWVFFDLSSVFYKQRIYLINMTIPVMGCFVQNLC